MVAAAVLLLAGLATPFVLRIPVVPARSPGLAIIGNVAALVVAWGGVLALAATAGGGVEGGVADLLELCRMFVPRGDGHATATAVLNAAVVIALPGRAALHLVRSCAEQTRLRRSLPVRGGGPVVQADIGMVACTVGVLVPRIVVDPAHFADLSPAHQRTVLAHERGHVRGRHLLVELIARCLAAGLAPLPGARLAVEQVRRQLEAAADDAAVKVVGRHAVARAIVDVATAPAPTVGALGATGWALWRVDRLLSKRPRALWAASVALGVIALAVLVTLHVVAHPLHAVASLDGGIWSVLCCVV